MKEKLETLGLIEKEYLFQNFFKKFKIELKYKKNYMINFQTFKKFKKYNFKKLF
jgi:hypothetical protein